METNKENKRKTRIGIVAVILVLLIAVGAVTGITLAKYVTSANITTQTATAAKWGFTLTADSSALFGTKYGSVSDNFASVINNGNGVVVSGSSDSNVVAPGTKGEAKVLSINGSAEVDAMLTITVNNSFKTIHLTNNVDTDYYPIKWKVNGSQVSVDNAVSANAFATAIAAELNKTLPSGVTASINNNVITVELPANTTINNFQLTISWEWALQTSKGDSGDTYYVVDDTILGKIAQFGTDGEFSSYAGSETKIEFGLSANVEQVQQFPSQQNG